MSLIVIGISHKTAPIEIRGKFSFTRSCLAEAQSRLKLSDRVQGGVILSTCNRMEIYAYSSSNEMCISYMAEFLSGRFGVSEKDLREYFYILEDEQAVRHIFEVACGLDSQVLGETEILAQVKSAWLISRESGLTNDFLDSVFEKAVEIGTIARQNTMISRGNVSIGSVAIKMLKGCFRSLRDKAVLIIGAGKIAGLMSKYLNNERIKVVFVSNRTYVRACELAQECKGEAINFNRLQEKLKDVDIVISSTASPHIILKKESIEEAMNMRQKPLLLLDLAVPIDIDPQVRDIAGVFLYDLDDLKSVIEKNYNNRKKEAIRVEEMIEKELEALSLYAAGNTVLLTQSGLN